MLTLPLYLASASPRRHELLLQIGVEHQILIPPAPAGEDEPIRNNETAICYVQRTALDKLKHAVLWRKDQKQLKQTWPILCADTTVELNGDIVGKPKNIADAVKILRSLSGARHTVHTAACLYYQDHYYSSLSSTNIEFNTLTEQDIIDYCASGEPLGKAGAYGIQGQAAIFIKQLLGSYSGVMGLDLFQTHKLFVQAGLKQTIA